MIRSYRNTLALIGVINCVSLIVGRPPPPSTQLSPRIPEEPPKWNYLITKRPAPPIVEIKKDYLEIPPLNFKQPSRPHLEEETSNAPDNRSRRRPSKGKKPWSKPDRDRESAVAAEQEGHPHPQNQNMNQFLKSTFKTSKKAIRNYFSAVKHMVVGKNGRHQEETPDVKRGDKGSPIRRIPTKYGTKQDYDANNRIKSVVVRGDGDSYLKEDDEDQFGWGLGSFFGDLFWGSLYNDGTSGS